MLLHTVWCLLGYKLICHSALILMSKISLRIIYIRPIVTKTSLMVYQTQVLGKHWRDTKGGAPFQCSQEWGAPFQCSPESDLNFHVEPNELHMMVCLDRPRHSQELYDLHQEICQVSNRWIRKRVVAT